MPLEMLSTFLGELTVDIIVTLPLYLITYFSSSYSLLSAPHGDLSKWNQLSEGLAMAICKTKLQSSTAQHSKAENVLSEEFTRNQILDLSRMTYLMVRAQDRISQYTIWTRFALFGVILSLSFAFVNSLPILITGSPLLKNPWAYSATMNAVFGLMLVVRFNWTNSIEWEKFNRNVAANKKLMKELGF